MKTYVYIILPLYYFPSYKHIEKVFGSYEEANTFLLGLKKDNEVPYLIHKVLFDIESFNFLIEARSKK